MRCLLSSNQFEKSISGKRGRSTMKKLFLIALAFMFALAGSELAVAHDAAAQDNQNTQAKTSVSDTTYHRRRHRRRHFRHTVVSKTKSVAEKSKEVGEATVDKSKSIGS